MIDTSAGYTTGAEANCSSSVCCREGTVAESSPNVTLLSAPRFGSYLWCAAQTASPGTKGLITFNSDTPYSLALAALESIPVLTSTQDTGFNFTIYTGDLVSHDPTNELSRDYVLYTEVSANHLAQRTSTQAPHRLLSTICSRRC